MPRYTNIMSIETLKVKINSSIKKKDLAGDESRIYNVLTEFRELFPLLERDLNKYNFNLENLIDKTDEDFEVAFKQSKYFNFPLLGYQTHNKMSFMGLLGGSDYGEPVFFLLYIDPKDNIRAYIPKDGNAINPISKSVFGDDIEKDDLFAKSKGYEEYGDYLNADILDLNVDLLLADIFNRIVVK